MKATNLSFSIDNSSRRTNRQRSTEGPRRDPNVTKYILYIVRAAKTFALSLFTLLQLIGLYGWVKTFPRCL